MKESNGLKGAVKSIVGELISLVRDRYEGWGTSGIDKYGEVKSVCLNEDGDVVITVQDWGTHPNDTSKQRELILRPIAWRKPK